MQKLIEVPQPRVGAASPARTPPVLKEKPAGEQYWTELLEGVDALSRRLAAWEDLVANALEPNVFYEPWMLLPALRHLKTDHPVRLVLVYRSPTQAGGQPVLCGLFPLQYLTRYKGLPVSCLRLWDYGECFLCTPLVRRDSAQACLIALLEWATQDRHGGALLELQKVGGEGPFGQLLVDVIRRTGVLHHVVDQFTRAWFRPLDSAESYLQRSLSANKRRDLQRKQRRLQERGRLDYRVFDNAADIAGMVDDFIRLEASGWKGQAGTALASRDENHVCFRALADEGARRGQVFAHGLYLNGEPIAFRWNFVSKPGAFFFKPAYDETYSAFSPGVLLEVETIRYLHSRSDVAWMDSCTSPANQLLNRLWLDRKIIQTLLLAPGRTTGRLCVSLLPMLRWVNRALGRYRLDEA